MVDTQSQPEGVQGDGSHPRWDCPVWCAGDYDLPDPVMVRLEDLRRERQSLRERLLRHLEDMP